VLQHVPQRHQALARLIAGLKPRGWLVIEEFDGRIIDRAVPTADADDAERYTKMARAVARLLDERGYEVDWPRRLYRRLKAAGLVEVGMEGHLAVREGGSPGARLDAAHFTQVREEAVAKELITRAEVDFSWSVLTQGLRSLLAPDVHCLGKGPISAPKELSLSAGLDVRSYSANWMSGNRTCGYVPGRRVFRTTHAARVEHSVPGYSPIAEYDFRL
jgi:hypothetical protein